jgi:HD-GYP domain-containing protein (c-di-GMP phosphodiesterase class II)
MVSARAYRAAIPIEDACNTLMEQAGAVFDRRPVSALTNYVDNRGGREQWASFGEPPEVEGA